MPTHSWRKGLPTGEILGDVDYIGVLDVPSAHLGLSNLVSSVAHISIDKVFTGTIRLRMVGWGCCHPSVKVLP